MIPVKLMINAVVYRNILQKHLFLSCFTVYKYNYSYEIKTSTFSIVLDITDRAASIRSQVIQCSMQRRNNVKKAMNCSICGPEELRQSVP